jgi:dTDP-4-dehydrorhamnose reductase
MKILVLGANGQVGSELCAQLNDVTCFEEGRFRIMSASRSDVDVTDLHALRGFLDYREPRWIINATAYTAVDRAETEVSQAYNVNENAVRVLAEYCVANNANLIHISTDYVFDGTGERPFCEESKVAPLGVYGASKFAGEEVIRSTLERHIILRTAWVFGASGGNFVKTMLRLAETRSELGVVGDQYGAPTSARGIAKAIATLLSQMSQAESTDKRWGTYHYSGKPFVSWAEFAREIFLRANQLAMLSSTPTVSAIATEQYPTPAKRPHNSRLDCSKIKEAFGIESDNWHQSLEEMLKEVKGVSLP